MEAEPPTAAGCLRLQWEGQVKASMEWVGREVTAKVTLDLTSSPM